MMPPDQAQRDAAANPEHSVLLRAPAGSGKTGVLLLRFLRCLLRVQSPEQVVAITFTNKAAAEIRERVMGSLRDAQQQVPADNPFEQQLRDVAAQVLEHEQAQAWGLMQNPSRLRIVTFDAFCIGLVRQLPLLSGLGQVSPSDDPDGLYREAIFSLFRQLDQRGLDADLRRALLSVLEYSNNRLEQLLPLLSNLLAKRDQWARALATDPAVMEEVLERHLLEVFEQHWQRGEAAEILPCFAALQRLSSESDVLAWAAEPDLSNLSSAEAGRFCAALLTKDGRLLARPTKSHGIVAGHEASAEVKAWLAAHREDEGLAEAMAALASLPDVYFGEQMRELCADFSLVLRHLLAHLSIAFEQRGEVDFCEVAFRAIQALSEDGAAGSELLMREDRIEHILVDEMQDTSVNQIDLLQRLCQAWEQDDGRSLFFCGDLQQSIYLFRGALVGLFEELVEQGEFANKPLALLQLSANFRSAAPLVNGLAPHFAALFEGQSGYVAAEAQRDTPGALYCHAIEAGELHEDRELEAERALALIKAEREAHGDSRSVAVLVRSRASLHPLIERLKAEGIGFAGQDIDRLAAAPHAQDYIAVIRALWHPADDIAWVSLLRASCVGLSWQAIWQLREQEQLVPEALEDNALLARLPEEDQQRCRRLSRALAQTAAQPMAADIRWRSKALWQSLGGEALLDERRRADIAVVHGVLCRFAPGGVLSDIQAFNEALDRLYAKAQSAHIELLTIHKSKGLEYDVVIVPAMAKAPRADDKPLFYWRSMSRQLVMCPRPKRGQQDDVQQRYDYMAGLQKQEASAEQDRQLYVALTRAKSELHLIAVLQEKKTKASSKKEAELEAGDSEWLPSKNSFLDRLWPSLGTAFLASLDTRNNAANTAETSSLAKSSLRQPCYTRLSMEPSLRVLKPLQRAWADDLGQRLQRLEQLQDQHVFEDNIEDRAKGIVYHELLRRIAEPEREADLGSLEAWLPAITQRLRHHCHPEQGIDAATEKLAELLTKTLSCDHGQWLLRSYRISGSEQALRKKLGEQWQRLIIDRFFVDAEQCWVIDYKTAECKPGQSLDNFFAAQAARYGEKMQQYAEALKLAGIAAPLRTALYFPAHQKLLEL